MNSRNAQPSYAAAFPMYGVSSAVQVGMNLRDYFAAKAMQGIIGREKQPEDCNTYDDLATMAYEMADAMLAAREAK